MAPLPFAARPEKFTSKTVTFTGAASNGAVGTVAVATITGMALITRVGIRATTALTSSGGTLQFGTTDSPNGIIDTTTASLLILNAIWSNANPGKGVQPALCDLVVNENLILTVGTANVTAGVLEFDFWWHPLSANGLVS